MQYRNGRLVTPMVRSSTTVLSAQTRPFSATARLGLPMQRQEGVLHRWVSRAGPGGGYGGYVRNSSDGQLHFFTHTDVQGVAAQAVPRKGGPVEERANSTKPSDPSFRYINGVRVDVGSRVTFQPVKGVNDYGAQQRRAAAVTLQGALSQHSPSSPTSDSQKATIKVEGPAGTGVQTASPDVAVDNEKPTHPPDIGKVGAHVDVDTSPATTTSNNTVAGTSSKEEATANAEVAVDPTAMLVKVQSCIELVDDMIGGDSQQKSENGESVGINFSNEKLSTLRTMLDGIAADAGDLAEQVGAAVEKVNAASASGKPSAAESERHRSADSFYDPPPQGLTSDRQVPFGSTAAVVLARVHTEDHNAGAPMLASGVNGAEEERPQLMFVDGNRVTEADIRPGMIRTRPRRPLLFGHALNQCQRYTYFAVEEWLRRLSRIEGRPEPRQLTRNHEGATGAVVTVDQQRGPVEDSDENDEDVNEADESEMQRKEVYTPPETSETIVDDENGTRYRILSPPKKKMVVPPPLSAAAAVTTEDNDSPSSDASKPRVVTKSRPVDADASAQATSGSRVSATVLDANTAQGQVRTVNNDGLEADADVDEEDDEDRGHLLRDVGSRRPAMNGGTGREDAEQVGTVDMDDGNEFVEAVDTDDMDDLMAGSGDTDGGAAGHNRILHDAVGEPDGVPTLGRPAADGQATSSFNDEVAPDGSTGYQRTEKMMKHNPVVVDPMAERINQEQENMVRAEREHTERAAQWDAERRSGVHVSGITVDELTDVAALDTHSEPHVSSGVDGRKKPKRDELLDWDPN